MAGKVICFVGDPDDNQTARIKDLIHVFPRETCRRLELKDYAFEFIMAQIVFQYLSRQLY
jgi:hypothetical protein